MIIQPSVADPASLHDDVLVMAGSVESEQVTWEDRLIRAGLLEE